MELAERITSRAAELTGEAEMLRKQLAGAGHELERLVIAGQVITQLAAGDAPAVGEPASAGPAQRGFGLLVPPRSQASGVSDLPGCHQLLAPNHLPVVHPRAATGFFAGTSSRGEPSA